MAPLSPDSLPPGTVLGPWRIEDRVGQGAYGAVYRAVRGGHEEAGPVALKLAIHPFDPRFEREVELLTRIQPPGVPRLLDHGQWEGGPWGAAHPYLVMEWVEGVRLYEWARQYPFSSRQALRLLAQIARCLGAMHSAHCLHRDVKGDNVLVGPDGRAFLLDFGCGTWKGAFPLTQGHLAPGTPPYRSPQALRFLWKHRRSTSARYKATPADDVYALGVTAYHLCTGTYPPPGTDPMAVWDEAWAPRQERVPPGQLATLAPGLERLILRMLSDSPRARGNAVELAETMEALVEIAGAEWDQPIVPRLPPLPVHAKRTAPRSPSQLQRLNWSLAAATLVAVLMVLVPRHEEPEESWVAPADVAPLDGGTRGLADAAVEEATASVSMLEPELPGVRLDMPKEPFPGQRRPPCPKPEIEILKGCWIEVARAEPPCGDNAYSWKGACYYPVASPKRPSTSNPP